MKRLMMILAAALAFVPSMAWGADTCSLSGEYVAGVVLRDGPANVAFHFTPPEGCIGSGNVLVSVNGEVAEFVYRVTTLDVGTFIVRPHNGEILLVGKLGRVVDGRAIGFAFRADEGAAGTAIAAAE